MRRFWFVCFFLVAPTSCSGTREPSHQTPVVSLQAPSARPSASSAPLAPANAAPSASAASTEAPAPTVSTAEPLTTTAPSASVPGPPQPYPDTWIMRARGENIGLTCTELVYKNGCSQTRTGIVTFRVTIDENGAVLQFSEIANEVSTDKALVSRCLKKNLPKWKFHPPEKYERTFVLEVGLADRC